MCPLRNGLLWTGLTLDVPRDENVLSFLCARGITPRTKGAAEQILMKARFPAQTLEVQHRLRMRLVISGSCV